ncbi:MAG: hypothetical protein JW969_11355 [Spirochaetales bacterium]|nr:hypothetical protein [Spirochaetales bacterium]
MYNEITCREFEKLIQSRKNFRLLNIIPEKEENFTYTPKAMLVRLDSIENIIPRKLDKQDLIVLHSKKANKGLIERAAEKLLSIGFKHLVIHAG